MNIKMLKMAFAGLVLGVSSFANAGLISVGDYDLTSISGNWSTGSTGWNLDGSVSLGLADTLLSDGYVDNFDQSTVNGIFARGTNSLTFGTGGVNYLLDSFSFITTRNYKNNSNFSLEYRVDGGLWQNVVSVSSNTLIAPLSSCLSGFNNLCSGQLATISFGGVLADEWRLNKINGDQVSFHEVSVSYIEQPITDVPEPSTLAIFALGMVGLASRRFKK